jgi:hypothetical protein
VTYPVLGSPQLPTVFNLIGVKLQLHRPRENPTLANTTCKINSSRRDVDPWEWIFVGDMPPAYLPLEDAPSKMAAFETYLKGMARWVAVAREGREPQPEDCCPAVNVPPTPERAEELDSRLRTLSEVIRPFFE